MKLAEDLRRSVLQAAVEGRLTGGSREGWRWVRLGDVVNVVSARRVHQSDWQKSGIPFYRAREIARLSENGYVDNELYISEELFEKYSHSGMPSEGDIMITAVGTLGKTYIVKKGDKFYYKDASVLCLEKSDALDSKYLDYVIKSDMFMNQVRKNSSGTTVATLTIVRMNEYIIPLPPIDEQRRIVSRLDAIMPLIAELESAENELEALERRFPGDMRDSLLQAAIEGRLTASNTDNWRYVRLGECALIGSGKTPAKDFLSSEGTIPFYRVADMNLQGNERIMNEANTFLTEKYKGKLTPYPSVIFPKNGGAVFTNKRRFLNKPALIDLNTGFIFPTDVNIEYLFYWFSSVDLSMYAIGTALPTVNASIISNLIIPLPPIDEQHKIAARLNELIPLCDAIENLS